MTLQHTAPFLRLLLPWSFGIYAGLQLRHSVSHALTVITLLCTIIVLSACIFSSLQLYRGKSIPSSVGLLLLFLTGLTAAHSRNRTAVSDHYSRFDVAPQFLLRISEPPRQGKGFHKCEAEVKTLIYQGFRRTCSGTILLYIRHDSGNRFEKPRYGDLIRIEGRLQTIPGAPYPEAFDYGAMMRERGIIHRIFIQEGQILKVGHSANPLLSLAHGAAEWTGNQLQAHFPPRIAAVLASLLIGLRSDIESQDIIAFKNTGTLHVLAVSGMHIALIFQVLMWFTGLLPALFPRIIRLLLVAISIWAYACISGFSASVCRAALMCSIMLLGKALRQDSTLANNLCATAFLLLLWEPRWLTDAGFLLSFSAVAGIIVFEPLFALLWKPKNTWLKHIRNLLSVSCAAQLGTLPVSLYFFHQFASYFLIGNLLIIPLSTIALFGGLFFLAIDHIVGIGPLIQTITTTTTSVMLETAGWIGQLPYALLEGWYLHMHEAMILTFLLGGCAWWLYEPVRRKPWLLMGSLCLFLGLHAMHHIQEAYLREAIIYSRKGKVWTLLFQRGRKACVLSNDTSSAHRGSMQAYLQRYRLNPVFHQWTGRQAWVHITGTHGSNYPLVGSVGGIWHAEGCSKPGTAPGIYVLNRKSGAPSTPRDKYTGRNIILHSATSGTFLPLEDKE